MKNKTRMKAPKGYRYLKPSEVLRKGDIYFDKLPLKSNSTADIWIGSPAETMIGVCVHGVLRKMAVAKKSTKKPAPKKRKVVKKTAKKPVKRLKTPEGYKRISPSTVTIDGDMYLNADGSLSHAVHPYLGKTRAHIEKHNASGALCHGIVRKV